MVNVALKMLHFVLKMQVVALIDDLPTCKELIDRIMGEVISLTSPTSFPLALLPLPPLLPPRFPWHFSHFPHFSHFVSLGICSDPFWADFRWELARRRRPTGVCQE